MLGPKKTFGYSTYELKSWETWISSRPDTIWRSLSSLQVLNCQTVPELVGVSLVSCCWRKKKKKKAASSSAADASDQEAPRGECWDMFIYIFVFFFRKANPSVMWEQWMWCVLRYLWHNYFIKFLSWRKVGVRTVVCCSEQRNKESPKTVWLEKETHLPFTSEAESRRKIWLV